jgi:transposase
MRNSPEILEVTDTQLEDVLRRVEEALDEKDAALIRRLFESYAYVTDLVEDKRTSIRRLRELLFGKPTEKTAAVLGRETTKTDKPDAPGPTGAAAEAPSVPDGPAPGEAKEAGTDTPPPPPGHGRNGAAAYTGATRIDVPHATLKPGDPCPSCAQGTLYEKDAGVVVRITGQPPLAATVYELHKLRCHLCGQVFTAEAPAEAEGRKYDATAGSMIGLLKYGSGLPFNRLAGLQGHLGIPLPASTQWDVVAAVAPVLAPAFEELIRQAAQGDVLHNDDTTVKILALMGERGRQGTPVDAEGEGNDAGQRTGLFTSGVVALAAGHRVALFFSGRQHAGENLADVLAFRAAELPAPIQMCDALSRNLPGELKTIVAHCLAHARRNFVDVYDRFPEPCGYLLETLAVVYHNDARARADELSPEARLRYHQQHSQPVMQQLHDWLKRQFDDKRVEPNAALGGAIRYMLNHWEKLTLFLRRAGAPLDNNVCERALKKAILHRKNGLFYRTANGAWIGDLFMSLIYTCELNEVNPFDYLTQLQRHADRVAAGPQLWMPWNYREALTNESGAQPP